MTTCKAIGTPIRGSLKDPREGVFHYDLGPSKERTFVGYNNGACNVVPHCFQLLNNVWAHPFFEGACAFPVRNAKPRRIKGFLGAHVIVQNIAKDLKVSLGLHESSHVRKAAKESVWAFAHWDDAHGRDDCMVGALFGSVHIEMSRLKGKV